MNTKNKTKTVLVFAVVAMVVIGLTGAPVQAAVQTYTEITSGDDSWNTAVNWASAIPSGTDDAVISDSDTASVNNTTTPVYSGTLTLGSNSKLETPNDAAGGSQNAFVGVSSIIMNAGSTLEWNMNANLSFPPIMLLGDALLVTPFGTSDHQTDNFAAITGAYTLTINGFNNHTFNLNTTNSFAELIADATDGYRIYAKAAGSLGTGDVTINGKPASLIKGCTLIIDAADAIADTATLYLNDAKSDRDAAKLILNADETIADFWVDGVQMAPGAYNSSSGLTTPNGDPLISGSGTLSVVPIIPPDASPANLSTVPAGSVDLSWTNLSPNTGSDVYVDVWFGTDPESLAQIIDAGVNTTSVAVSAPVADTYYWQVNSYLDGSPTGDPVEGTLFRFYVIDTDGDGLPDDYERLYTDPPSPTALNPADDLEPDGLTNIEEYQIGTEPDNPDTDNDTLEDGPELAGAGLRPPTDPLDADTDDDGLNDGAESNTGIWASATDTGTNPTVVDTDADGLRDGVETNTGTFSSDTDTGTHPLEADSDVDGAGDWYEVAAAYTDPTVSGDKPNIPYPLPDPDGSTGSTASPVKVYILSGQSNMVGFGRIGGMELGTLQTITGQENKFPNLVDDGSGSWSVCNDVMYRGVITAIGDDPLIPGFGANTSSFGPELGFGHVMGWYHDEPILLIKTSQGNRSLGWDFLPPGSERFTSEDGTITYGGYGDKLGSWPTGEEPEPPVPGDWYAGIQYDQCFMDESNWVVANTPVTNVTDILDNFASEYPQYAAQGFEITGFGWWQGHKDQGEPYASRYEFNMINFINEIRDYYENRYPANTSPNAPFVLATIAFGGWDLAGAGLIVADGQLAVSGETGNYPEFAGNVKTIEARGYWRDSSVSPTSTGYHYNHNAETYMLVGDALGRAMIELNTSYSVDAGPDMITWSGEPVELDATVQDDVTVVSYAWSAMSSDPSDTIVLDSDSIEDPTVTITKEASGDAVTVKLTLTVNDGVDPPVANTMKIDVYDDACKAAVGNGAELDPGDINEDCNTDIDDLAQMALAWLEDHSLTEPAVKP